MQRRSIAVLLFLFLATFPVGAHVGNPDVFLEGDAGPYHLFVTVLVPQVIPGVAQIQVRSASSDVKKIEVVPMRLSGPGSDLPPTPDEAEGSKQDPQFFTASLWLMEFGALKVRVTAEGSKGKGELAVPVPAFARRSLPMDTALGGLLGFLMLFLGVGLVFIAGAAAREGDLEPGESPLPTMKIRARIVMAITAIVVLGILYLGNAWWGLEAKTFSRDINLFMPPLAETSLENGNHLIIRAAGRDPEWSKEVKMEDIIPDHGHLMHLFLIGAPGLDRLWHLHPVRALGGTFADDLPLMPAGQYQIFADIVDKSGFPWTLVGRTDVPQVNGKALTGDDSAWSGPALAPQPSESTVAQLGDGGRLVWAKPREAIAANIALDLKFKIEDKDGNPARDVEPYMGMAGHAEIVGSDFSTFAHIHPAGSVSMAALELANSQIPSAPKGLLTGQMAMPGGSAPLPPEVSFPYGFPKAGIYRIFVQIKRAGQIETGVFDVHVQ